MVAGVIASRLLVTIIKRNTHAERAAPISARALNQSAEGALGCLTVSATANQNCCPISWLIGHQFHLATPLRSRSCHPHRIGEAT